MTEQRLMRWMALSGLGSTLLFLVGFFAVGGDSPSDNASGADVVKYYRDNLGKERASTLLVLIGCVLLVFFGAALRHGLQPREGSGATLAGVAFAGAIVTSGGLLLGEAIHFALTAAADNRLEEAARTLNVLDNNDFFPVVGGLSILFLATGIATVRSPLLPRWLGWVSIVLGIVAVAGPLGQFAFLLTPFWLITVSIFLFRRIDAAETAPAAAP